MTIINSYGGHESNSYLSLAEANDIIKGGAVLNNAAWLSANNKQKEAALREATVDIDTRQFIGEKYFFEQRLEFPRQLKFDFPFNRTEVATFTDDSVQARMKADVQEACAHQAVWLLRNNGMSEHTENQHLGLASVQESTGPIRDFYQYRKGFSAAQTRLHPNAMARLQEWLTTGRIFRA